MISGHEPIDGKVFSVILSQVSMAVLAVCLCRRVQNVRDWARLPLVCWLIVIIYFDSIIFVMTSSTISLGYNIEKSKSMCAKAIIVCLACYMTTKVFIYYFLVERAYIIRGNTKPRLKDKMYLVNSLGVLGPYCVLIALNFLFRFSVFNPEEHTCRIGMKEKAMAPLIGFDVLINVYLTSLFLVPLRSLYSYRINRNSQTRTLALRTFIGSCCTLASSIVNLTLLMVLKGEPGWICLMCCNVDILFSVLVLHWITSRDNVSTIMNCSSPPIPLVEPMSPTTQTPRKLVPRPPLSDLEAFEFGLRELKRPGVVVTRVTATSYDDIDDLGLQRINTLPPMHGISVETEHKREVVNIADVRLDPDEIVVTPRSQSALGSDRELWEDPREDVHKQDFFSRAV